MKALRGVLKRASFCLFEELKVLKRVFPDYGPQPNIGCLPGRDVKWFGDRRDFPSSTYLVVK
jgi:hypothetical protein